MSAQAGYAGSILRIDLSTGNTETVPTELYSDRFLGGRGVAAKIHWDEVPADADAFAPENRLVAMTGPVCGVPGFAGSRWQFSGKAPGTNQFSYSNLGGAWGAHLKFAGYDGLVICGKADNPVFLEIDDNHVEIKDASHLSGKGAISTREILKQELGASFRVTAVGPAGENGVVFATLLADSDASGSSGLGAVMGAKNLKAIAVRGTGKIPVADREAAAGLRRRARDLKCESFQWPNLLPKERIKRDICFGCIDGCIRSKFLGTDGRSGKYMCQAAAFYEIRAQRYYKEITEVPFQATKLCDEYGLNTYAVEAMIMWLSRCAKAGVLSEQDTGLPLSKMGSREFIETLVRKIALREGFGRVLAEGVLKAAETVGQGSGALVTDYMIRTGEGSPYGPRLYLTTGLLYATEPRMPIQQLHEICTPLLLWVARVMGMDSMMTRTARDNYVTSEVIRAMAKRFWGDEIAADFSTYDGKARCAARVQDRQYAKESLILCDFSWPIMHSPVTEDHVGDPGLESRVCAAVTGRNLDEQELYKLGERVFNLQRAVLAREGRRGRAHDTVEEFNYTIPLKGEFGNPECLVPGENGQVLSRKGMVLDRDSFERMKDEYYAIRGWDVSTGLQTRKNLEELDLSDIADALDREELLA